MRIGIVADIAAVTVMTMATATSTQTQEPAGESVPQGLPFGVMLMQLVQPAIAADAAAPPVTTAAPGAPPGETATNEQKPATVPQSGGLAAILTAATSISPDVQATIQDGPQKESDSKPAVKDDEKGVTDADTPAEPKNAPDADLLAALTQQTPTVAIQPQIVQAQTPAPQDQDDATAVAIAARAGAASVTSDAKSAPVAATVQPGKEVDAISDQTADSKQSGADNSGPGTGDAAGADTPDVDAPKANAKAAAAPGPSPAPHDPAPVQNVQSSVSGQSANTSAPSVTAALAPAQAQTANAVSANVNLQVAPQHHESASTPTMDMLGLAIAAKSADGIKYFDIRMDPPELGRVEVHLSLDDTGKAQASLVVDKPQTLELLQRDAAGLTRSLTDAGVSLSNNGLNFSLRGQDRQNDGSVVKGRSRTLSVKAVMGTDAISNSSSIRSLAPDSVRLDIRV